MLTYLSYPIAVGYADEPATPSPAADWHEQAIQYARIMSRVQWTPVSEGMPGRNGLFKKGAQQTGVPYSSVKGVGRTIGFDIFLKTFLAAVENPESVLYTESLEGKVSNAECYYGKVCSSYTCYALQCGTPFLSRLHVPPYREGAETVETQTAQFSEVGDVIFTPPKKIPGGSHIELVTEVTRDKRGTVTHVRVEEIPLEGKDVIERTFTKPGDYTATCVRRDGSLGQACEFSVCSIGITLPEKQVSWGELFR